MPIFNQLCQRIRDITLEVDAFIQDDNIEQCYHLLVTRQTLLDELKEKCNSTPEKHLDYAPVFIELIQWIKLQDAVNQAQVIKLKKQNKQASVKQAKVNKAIHQYKNII